MPITLDEWYKRWHKTVNSSKPHIKNLALAAQRAAFSKPYTGKEYSQILPSYFLLFAKLIFVSSKL